MKMHKKVMSIFIAITLVFSGLPVQFKNFDRAPYVHAGESPPVVNIRYDEFSNAEDLQLNGDSLIVNNSILFESEGGVGESIFIKDKVALGEKLSFSTAFVFKNIPPDNPSGGKKGGFTFTLQSVGNTATASSFHDEDIQPSLSIAFVTDYYEPIPTTRITEPLQLASLSEFKVAQEPPIRCGLSTASYINGNYDSVMDRRIIDSYYIGEEISEYYNVWIGYDGEEEILHIVCIDSNGKYTYMNNGLNLSEILTSEVFVGFMGSIGDTGDKSEISRWYFKNDLDLLNEALVDADEAWLTDEMILNGNSSLDNVTQDLYLPIIGDFGSNINWESSNIDVIDINGRVITPLKEEGDQEVTLTATISSGPTETRIKTFYITVKVVEDETYVIADNDWLTDEIILNGNSSLDNITQILYFPTTGNSGSMISWTSSNIEIVPINGNVIRPSFTDGDQDIILTATISKNLASMTRIFNIKVKAVEPTDEERINADNLWLNDALVLNGNSDFDNIVKDMNLPYIGPMGSNINWQTSNELVIKTNGDVIRPSYTEGDKIVTLTANINIGSCNLEKTYTATVKALEPSDIEIVNLDYSWLTDELVLNENINFNNIVEDMNLPDKGPMGSNISWTSSNPEVVDIKGQVTRPHYTKDYEVVVLTANINMGSKEIEKIFTIKVIALEATNEDIVNADNLWLTNIHVLKENSNFDNIVGDLNLPDKGLMGSNISWTSSNPEVVDIKGQVTRPTYTQGDKSIVLTAKISMGLKNIEKIFNIIVKALDETIEEKVNADKEWLTDLEILKDNTSLDNILVDMNLPNTGPKGSNINWISSNHDFVLINGEVTRPTYTQGDKLITMTAKIIMGPVILEKLFNIKVKALEASSEEIVNNDNLWLTDLLVLNENSDFDNITKDLNLPDKGPMGSDIIWSSDKENIVNIEGIVTRPKYSKGDQIVTLTVTITKGSFTITKEFIVKVIKLKQSDEEKFEADKLWLTESQILNDNESLEDITGDLILPVEGPNGSTISWSSDNNLVVDMEGKVTRPKYEKGNQIVTLTTTISKGTFITTIEFTVIVIRFNQTDEEAVFLDEQWLSKYNILGKNLTANSVTENLLYPTGMGPCNSVIIWSSDTPSVIFHDGTVIRPENGEGHKSVKVKATLSKGEFQYQKIFSYVVLEKPDILAPVVVSTTPNNNSTEVLWDTNEIIIRFNEDIVFGSIYSDNPETFGISLKSLETVKIGAEVEKDKLIIKSYGNLSSGENRLIIPAGSVVDNAGNYVDDYELIFTVEPKITKEIAITSTAPEDIQVDVDINTSEIKVLFDSSELVLIKNYYTLGRVGDPIYKKHGIAFRGWIRPLKGNEATLMINNLEPGSVYEIIIEEGTVQDRFGNMNEKKIIRFRTKYETGNPYVISTNPSNEQTGVNVKQSDIKIVFSQKISSNPYINQLTLTDDKGNKQWGLIPKYTNSAGNELTLRHNGFRPNTVYTLSGPYGTLEDPSQIDFSVQFTTSTNELMIEKTAPYSGQRDIYVNSNIEINFNYPIEKGNQYDSIRILDLKGESVDFIGTEVGTKAVFEPIQLLKASQNYTVKIPEGAFKGKNNTISDDYQFSFITVDRLDLSMRNIEIPDMGLVNKQLMLSAWETENIARGHGSKIISYEWLIDGQVKSTKSNFYTLFKTPGIYKVELVIKDNKGNIYEFQKDIEIEDLTDIKMVLLGDNTIRYVAPSQTIDYNLKLVQNGQFVEGERIAMKLYKDGVLQRDYPNYITTNIKDDVYKFKFTPEIGDSGTYELEFSHKGIGKPNIIRVPVVVLSLPVVAKEVKFRLYSRYYSRYFEEAESMTVFLNGKKMNAVKKWYADKNYYAYTILNESIIANTYYILQVDGWTGGFKDERFYVEKEPSDAYIISGFAIEPGTVKTSMDYSETTIKDYCFENLFFEGLSAKLAIKMEPNWDGAEPGYYEIKSTNGLFNMKVNADEHKGIQKIVLDPGLQLKAGEYSLLIRSVSKQGIGGGWNYFLNFNLNVVTIPSVLGKKLSVEIQGGEYAINWPTIFDGAIGDSIGFLDGIPVVEGGSFGIGSSMPNFEGYLSGTSYEPYIDLNFGISGGYGEKSKTKKDTNYKKLKKVTVVGYSFEISVEGGLSLNYDTINKEWDMNEFYIWIIGDGTKEWSKGYTFLGVGFSAGVGIGAEVAAGLGIENMNTDPKYKGIIRITPHAFLRVSGDFVLASVDGYLNGNLPAEIHFPTGYIGADVRLNASIYAKALLWGKTIYEKEIYGAHWDNGKDKVVIRSMQAEIDDFSDNTPIQLISRDYSNRQSIWIGGDLAVIQEDNKHTLASIRSLNVYETSEDKSNSNPSAKLMMENIYPYAELQLVNNGDELWLVWSDDNPERDATNRTQLRYSVLKNSRWSEPLWIDSDGTADFAPTVAATGNGVLMAWQNIGKVITEEDGLSEMLKNSEISVTENVYTADGSTPNIITLTKDDSINHSPKIAADGEKALLVWTKSEGLGFSFGNEEVPESEKGNQLYHSSWNNGIWSEPESIGDSSSIVFDSSLSMAEDKGLLLYTLDMDKDLFTFEDREIFARLYNGENWSEEIQITNNSLNDSVPKSVYIDGQWFITWLQDGNIMYKVGLAGITKTEENLRNIQGDYQIAVKHDIRPMVSLIYTEIGEDKGLGISSLFYDIDKEQWGNKVSLVAPVKHTKAISSVFTEDRKLNIVFSQADIITEAVSVAIDGVEQLVEQPNISNKVDMSLLTYTPVHDLALLEEDGILLSKEFPLPSTITTIYVTLRNEGDFSEYAKVSIYDGNPNSGGIIIGELASQLISARSSKEVEIEWLVDSEERNSYDLYAVIESDEGGSDININNNMINLEFSTADLSIKSLTYENLSKDDYLVTVTIANSGGKTLDGAMAMIGNITEDKVIETKLIKSMKPGEQRVLSYIISSTGLLKDENGKINIFVLINPPEGVKEDFTENNFKSFSLELEEITVDSLNIGPGDKNVDPNSAFTITFNMNVTEGTEYDQIRLIDEELNKISVNKKIEGNILTITPQKTLDSGTKYTLTIPAESIGDDYGHKMDKNLSVNFTTTSINPEIIFAYPGEFMENTALNTEIRLKFNQNMLKGDKISKISLINPEGKTIPVSSVMKESFLVVNYLGNLDKNTRYSLEVPRGAVQNENEESLWEDYLLMFTTGEETTEKEEGEQEEQEEEDNSYIPSLPDNSNKTKYQVNINLKGINQKIDIIKDGNKAVIKLGTLAVDIFNGNQNTVLNIPEIPGVNSYTVEIQAESIDLGKSILTINTVLGSIDISPDMFSTIKNIKGKTIGITIASIDKSKIPLDAKSTIGNRPVIKLSITLNDEEIAWSNKDNPVKISIPYTPKGSELEYLESIVVWYIDANGNITTITNGHYDQQDKIVRFNTTDFSNFAIAYNKIDFKDVKSGIWYEKSIRFMAAREITNGTGNDKFSPDDKLTRGQFITMMMRAYSIEPSINQEDNFSDAGNTWYTGYLATAKQLGISKGVGNNIFAPDNEITRQEMFTLIYNTLKIINQLPERKESDIKNHIITISDFIDKGQIASWAKEAMNSLVESGTIIGSSGKLKPLNIATRAEMAQILYNLMTR